jgi:hypothetical protein
MQQVRTKAALSAYAGEEEKPQEMAGTLLSRVVMAKPVEA